MSCFPCFSSKKSKNLKRQDSDEQAQSHHEPTLTPPKSPEVHSSTPPKPGSPDVTKDTGNGNIKATTFTFRELAAATKNFRPECLLGEGGFGRVYKGFFEKTSQVAAIKQLDRNGLQGNKEFLVEVLMLSQLHHPNLVNLLGYCADGDQRLLVYEFMPLGSLEDHLLDLPPDKKPLPWHIRMKIAIGAAKGLEYLHEKANPPVIYRDLKSSNILLDEDFDPRLSDFGLAKLGPGGDDKLHVSSRVMGTYGYCAPEYARSGELTLKSDVYSFGVVLLEMITGRRAIDPSKPMHEQNLVTWAQPMFKDQKRFVELADPLLDGNYPLRELNQAVAVAAMCLQEEAMVRPFMTDAVMALSFLSTEPPPAPPKPVVVEESAAESHHSSSHHSLSRHSESSDSHHSQSRHSQSHDSEHSHGSHQSESHHSESQRGSETDSSDEANDEEDHGEEHHQDEGIEWGSEGRDSPKSHHDDELL